MSSAILRPTANRAVHLKITPRPSNIGESREIMRLISQFGEVEYFKSLRYDAIPVPNTTIVIFKDEEAAQRCLQKSPIRFRMGKAPAKQDGSARETGNGEEGGDSLSSAGNRSNPFSTQTRSIFTTSAQNARLPNPGPRQIPGFTSPLAPEPIESRIFQINSNPARANFRDMLNMSHFHGHFAVDTKSAAQHDLAKRVPLQGLSDVHWRAEGKPWKVVEREREFAGSFRGSGRRKSLQEIYDEGERGNAD